MDLTQFYTREIADTTTYYIDGCDNRWWVTVKPLNNRERRQREQLALRERRFIPRDPVTQERDKRKEYEETALEYQIAEVKNFEYKSCIEDFCLPYLPKDAKNPVDFKFRERTESEVKKFLDNMPLPLTKFVEDAIAKVNREGEFAKEGEEIKNDSEPL